MSILFFLGVWDKFKSTEIREGEYVPLAGDKSLEEFLLCWAGMVSYEGGEK